MEYNAKCPLCGNEFSVESDIKDAVCPKCGQTVSAMQAVKYYESFSENSTEKKFAYGEDYHRVNFLLDQIKDFIADGNYDAAKLKIDEALNITDTDYRVYMAMVAVCTKNYTDLTDETHKQYIEKAISVADSDGKKDIAATYRNYYDKTKLSKEELEQFTEEEVELKKDRVEKSLKKLIPEYMAKEKRNKILLILFPIFMAVGIVISIPFAILGSHVWVVFIGLALIIGGYLIFRIWYTSREAVSAFNAILDLYDVLDGIDLPPDCSKRIYDYMYKVYLRFVDNDPIVGINRDVTKLIDYTISLNNDEINEFIYNNKYLSENIPSESYE